MGDENDGGVVSQFSASGTYSIAANGRMTITINGMGTVPEVFYLVKPGKAFSVGTGGAVSEGALKPQDLSGGPFSNASLSGSFIFGTEPTVMNDNSIEAGVANMDGAGNVTGMTDANQWPGSATFNSFIDLYSIAPNGRVVTGNNIMYIIAPSKAVMMSSQPGDTHPKLQTIDK